MDFIAEYFTLLGDNLLPGIRIEGTRYLIGTLGIFFLTWILLKPMLKKRLIRKRPPGRLLNKQVMREIKNSFFAILTFIAAYSFIELSLDTIFGVKVFKNYHDINDYPLWWVPVSILVFAILLDT